MKRFLPLSLILLLAAGMSCSGNTTNTNVANYNTGIVDEDAIAVETSDVYGKDIDQIERYPGSIRSYYSKSDYETDVTYQTTAEIEDVRAFYNTKLTDAGWTNSEEATDYMEYVKGDDENPEIMTVYLTSYDSQGILEYELVYEPALSEEELADQE
jgi:hypothetical protein